MFRFQNENIATIKIPFGIYADAPSMNVIISRTTSSETSDFRIIAETLRESIANIRSTRKQVRADFPKLFAKSTKQ